MDCYSQSFKNLILSLYFLDINNLDTSPEYIDVYNYIDIVLINIMNTKKVKVYCKQLSPFIICKVIELCEYFNNMRYKSNVIMEKLIYILYYYIQNQQNIHILYQTNDAIQKLQNIRANPGTTMKPIIKNLLNLLLDEINEYVKESRDYTFQIISEEMTHMPTDIIQIIVDYMPDQYILNIVGMFKLKIESHITTKHNDHWVNW